MSLNPVYILNEKILTLPKSIDLKVATQPNGIDIYTSSVLEILPGKYFSLGDNETTQHLDERELELVTLVGQDEKNQKFYKLEAGKVYKIVTDYELNLPTNVEAIIVPRSSLNRNGIQVSSGWWDSGFKGKIGFTIYPRFDTIIYLPCRLAQIIFFKSESAFTYNGNYGEGKKQS